ncbi:MAG: tetratricopeptide repeat protein [Saprospiraceae bacterium]
MKTTLLLPVFFLSSFIADAQNADSLSVVKQVDSLIQVSQSFSQSKNFEKALEVLALAEQMVLEKIGAGTKEQGNIYYKRGQILYTKGDYPDAEKSFLLAISIQEKTLGKEHPDYARSLSKLARLYYDKGDYDKAEPLNLTVKDLYAQIYGKKSNEYAWAVGDIGEIYKAKGYFEKAEPFFLENRDILAETVGKENLDYALSLNNLGRFYRRAGDFKKTEVCFLEAKDIIVKKTGNKSSDYAMIANNLGLLYTNKCEYEKAEPFLLVVKDIDEKNKGKLHPEYAQTLVNLAIFYSNKGDYSNAERFYLEAIEIMSKTIGKEHKNYAMTLNNLAAMYYLKGDYSKAESGYLEATAIYAKTLGNEHPNYAAGLMNLADLYYAKGDFKKVEPLFLEAKNIYAKTSGVENFDYAKTLNGLAHMEKRKGNYQKSEQLYLEAKEINAKTFGLEHPNYASSLNNLADLFDQTGDYDKAKSLYLEAKNIIVKSLGANHPRYASSLFNLACLYQKTKNITESAALFLELNDLDRQLVEAATTYSSEDEMHAYLQTFEQRIAGFQSITQIHPSPELCNALYDNNLFYNGLLLENGRLMTLAIAGSDSLIRDIYIQWQGCHRRLAKRYARPIAERKKIAEVEAEAEGYEKLLMRSLPAFQEARKIPKWQDIRDHLKEGEAAIEFLHYPFFSPEQTDRIQYAALVLRPGWDAAKLIPLFEEKQLDSLLHTPSERKADYVHNLYSIADRGIIVAGKPKKSLFDLIWEPIEKELISPSGVAGREKAVKTVFFSSTGLLHRLNLAAIPISTLEEGQGSVDSTLADRYHLIQLGSTRSLAVGTKAGQLFAQATTQFNNHNAILFGGIQFDMDSTAIFAANARLKNSDLASRGPAEETNMDPTSRGDTWNYLKWTEKEVNAIAPILSSGGIIPETRNGFEATEEAFKNIGVNGPSPRILHLATHGFFFPDLKDTTHQHKTPDTQETGFKTSENPLIRSGLLLAGANYAWKTGKPFKKGLENGILTAYEISHMNLINTELVVLSACETGLGDIQGNEGVYGLQRAFKIAGAKYLIMSLWKVPDFQTQELMTTFYSKWLTEKMNLPEAFRSAQQEMREKYGNPYFWAGFVLVE